MNKTLLLLSTLLLGSISSHAQVSAMVAPGTGNADPTNYIKTDLVSPSPNAASIGRYGEIPVNLSTGMASLSIPLFTMQGNELSLPISLSYSYDGYKPAQPVSWIGLGWSLNAGGVISLTIKDRLDDSANQGANYDDPSVKDSINKFNGPGVGFLNSVALGHIDSEPDVYSFNFGNYSGKFIKYNGKYYCFPSQKIKISPATPSGFKIATEDGVQYFFTATETTTPKGTYGVYNIPSHVSSWYLTKVTNAAGTESIYLDYTQEATIAQSGSFTQTYKKYKSRNMEFGQPIPQSSLFDPKLSYPTYVTPLRLVSITSEKHKATFNGIDREDIEGNKALSSIVIQSNTGNILKDFRFKHSYNANLTLDTLIEVGENSDDVIPEQYVDQSAKKHVFDYLATSGIRRSTAWVDHYGYYTGKGEFITTLIPNTIYQSGVDRSPVLSGTQQGAMTKVTYPTGGYSTFEYELNKKYDGVKYTGETGNKSYTINRPANQPTGTITSPFMSFTLVNAESVTVYMSRVPVSASGDGIVHSPYKDFQISGNGITYSAYITHEAENAGKTYTYNLPAGTYSFTVYCDEKEKTVSGSLIYPRLSTTPIEGAVVGGLRIKRIVSYPMTGQSTTKEYRYTRPSGFSSGVSKTGNYDIIYDFEERVAVPDTWSWYSNFYDIVNSTIAENYYMGVPHYYTSVLEATSSGPEKLYTRTEFSPFGDTYLGMGVEPIRVIKYKNGVNNSLVPIERVDYNYQIAQDTFFRALRPKKIMEASAGPDPQYNYTFTEYSHYSAWKYLASQRNVSYEGTDSLETIIQNGYDVNGSKNLLSVQTTDSRGLQQITRYKYPESYNSTLNAPYLTANVLTPVFEEQSWSKSGSDSVLVSAALTEYNSSQFRPVKIRTLNAKYISTLNNQPKDGSGKYTTLVSDTRFEERVNYTYDSYGKIIRQQLTGGPPVSYKWAHGTAPHILNSSTNKTYVIAECRNATETEFYYEGFEEDASTTIGTGHTGNRFKTGAHTVSWTRPNNRQYVITYWYRSAGVWKLKPLQDYITSSLALTGGDAYDDIRIYPKDAQVSTYTHFPGVGLSSMTDAKDMTTYYEYDEHHRLKNVKDAVGNIVQNMDYRYAGSQLVGYGAGPYGNTVVSITFTKNNCDTNETGSSVTYTVTANKYKGATQAEADAYAQADLQANGQNYANQHGTCTSGGVIPEM